MDKCKNFVRVILLTIGFLLCASLFLLTGCTAAHITLYEPISPNALDPINTENAPVSESIQVVNFKVNLTGTGAYNKSPKKIRQNLSVSIANKIYNSLGRRRAFSSVTRSESIEAVTTGYIVKGVYDFSMVSYLFFGSNVSYKGAVKVQVIEAKTGKVFFEKNYVEAMKDRTISYSPAEVTWLGAALIEEISADIRQAFLEKVALVSG